MREKGDINIKEKNFNATKQIVAVAEKYYFIVTNITKKKETSHKRFNHCVRIKVCNNLINAI